MDYLFITMVNYLFSAFFFSAAFPFVPAFTWVLNLLIIVTVIDIMGVKPAAFCTMAAFHSHIHRFINPDQE
ncbi:hypothetical protein V3595_13870 [Bacillus sp. CFBP9009]